MAIEETTTTEVNRVAEGFELLLAKIQRTQDRHGPAAAWLVDEHTDRLEDILDKADDPSSLVLESLDQLGLNSTGIATWARALRLQSRHLRRQIA